MKTKPIIDAVATRINTLALPAHRTGKYYRPLSLSGPTGALLPFLAVSPAHTKPELQATNSDYSNTDKLLITWYAGQMSQVGVGIADEPAAAATLDHVSLIANEIETWGVGVPGLAGQSEATLTGIDYGHIEGGIWTAELAVDVQTWGF